MFKAKIPNFLKVTIFALFSGKISATLWAHYFPSSVMKAILLFSLIFMLSSCKTTEESISQSDSFSFLIAQYQRFHENSNPFNNPIRGKTNRQLPDISEAALKQRYLSVTNIISRLQAIDSSSLSTKEQVNHAVLLYKLKNEADNYTNKEHYMPLTAESGFHIGIQWQISQVELNNVEDYQDYLFRLKALPAYFEQQMYWMKKGIETGITQPKQAIEGFENSIASFLVSTPEQSPYFLPFKKKPTFIDEGVFSELSKQAKATITNHVTKSYQRFYDFFVNEYLPAARSTIGVSERPQGRDYYNNRVAHYTTTSLSAEQIHNIGLGEVARIKAEMNEVIMSLNYKGDFKSFVEFLRTDERFYAKTPEELLKEASYIAKKMDAQLPKLFKKLPRIPYGIAPVPDNIAPKYTTGRYVGARRDDQPGYYWVNTYQLNRRPLYVLEALTLHEAVPGHHLQNALAREQEGVPKYRRHTYISAFGEGWGLYSEYLGKEAGFYQDPYSEFGRLTYEMWRACRLVVDTGMHIKGWSRKKAINFLADNTALSLHNVTTEVDRYITWPGQALSYKIGELTIKRLREKAEKALGSKFDLREFHDQILMHGSVPLSMLERLITEYIEEKGRHAKLTAGSR